MTIDNRYPTTWSRRIACGVRPQVAMVRDSKLERWRVVEKWCRYTCPRTPKRDEGEGARSEGSDVWAKRHEQCLFIFICHGDVFGQPLSLKFEHLTSHSITRRLPHTLRHFYHDTQHQRTFVLHHFASSLIAISSIQIPSSWGNVHISPNFNFHPSYFTSPQFLNIPPCRPSISRSLSRYSLQISVRQGPCAASSRYHCGCGCARGRLWMKLAMLIRRVVYYFLRLTHIWLLS